MALTPYIPWHSSAMKSIISVLKSGSARTCLESLGCRLISEFRNILMSPFGAYISSLSAPEKYVSKLVEKRELHMILTFEPIERTTDRNWSASSSDSAYSSRASTTTKSAAYAEVNLPNRSVNSFDVGRVPYFLCES